MDRALWLLLGLRIRGLDTSYGAMLKTVKGALLGVIGAVVFGLMFIPVIVGLFFPKESRSGDPRTSSAMALWCFWSTRR